jgi:hypothetical protein
MNESVASSPRGPARRRVILRVIAVVAILPVAVAVYLGWSEWVAIPQAREVGSYWAEQVWGRPEPNIQRIDKATWDTAADGVVEEGPTHTEPPSSVPQSTFPGIGPYYFSVGTEALGAKLAVWRSSPFDNWRWSRIDVRTDQ